MADDPRQKGPGQNPSRSAEEGSDDYTQQERDGFGIWVELGALNHEQQWILGGSLSRRWERRDPSGSEWVMDLLRDPRRVLMGEKVAGVHERSRITTTILHHHRGLRKKIIVTTVTVERHTGDASIVIDKETADSD